MQERKNRGDRETKGEKRPGRKGSERGEGRGSTVAPLQKEPRGEDGEDNKGEEVQGA